jgi:hypothetical protein
MIDEAPKPIEGSSMNVRLPDGSSFGRGEWRRWPDGSWVIVIRSQEPTRAT